MSGTPHREDTARTLVAGVGNVFLGDDGFGAECVRALREHQLPPGVEAADFGVRGVHLAYQLLDGYDTLILVDATARGGAPGSLYLIEPGTPEPEAAQGAVLDGHHMSPDAVLALLGTLCSGTGARPPRRTLVIGCEPLSVEEGIGLSAPVAAAVPDAVRWVRDLVQSDDPGTAKRETPVPTATRTHGL